MIGEHDAELADPDCLAAGESEELLAGHPWRRVVVLGDSVANGPFFPVPGYSPLRWSDRVAAELRAAAPDLQYRNLGVSGLRAAEVRAGQLAEALEFEPDLALVVCGANDAFRPSYAGEAVEAVSAELGAMLAALRSAGAQPVTIGAFNASYGPAVPDRYRLQLRQRLALLAEQTRVAAARYDCVHVDLTRHPRISDPGLYAPDGRHGNARSDAIAAAETVRALGARFRLAKAQPSTMAKPLTSAPKATFITEPPPG